MFDWLKFLTQHNIDFTTASRYHVTMGNVGILCPWCTNDTGYNLHISLQGRGFHCFRVDSHKGIAPQPLIQRLLNCPYAYADSLVQEEPIPTDRDLVDRLRTMFQPERNEPIRQQTLGLPDSFEKIKSYGSTEIFVNYMNRRGFDHSEELARRYDLRCCTDSGRWHGRIIFPITLNHKLITWTGRHVGSSPIRYLTLSVNDADSPALDTIKHTVLWYDRLKQQHGTLVVCEGPFDALKINYLGEGKNIHATSIFGKSITEEQRELLESLDNFDRRILLLDSGTTDHFNPRGNFASLESAGFRVLPLPLTIKDPGELDRESFSDLLC